MIRRAIRSKLRRVLLAALWAAGMVARHMGWQRLAAARVPGGDPARASSVDRMTATAINDRCVGGMRCHGSIVPLRATMLVG